MLAGRPDRTSASDHLRPDRHTATLATNESGIRFELEFLSSFTAQEETAHRRRRDGRILENTARAQQLGRDAGWLEFDCRRIKIEDANLAGRRDHSWGVRAEMRADETSPPLSTTRRPSGGDLADTHGTTARPPLSGRTIYRCCLLSRVLNRRAPDALARNDELHHAGRAISDF